MLNSLQILRAIGAILIFLHHFGFGGPVIMSFGDFAVALFMLLSGYVLCLAYSPRKGSLSGPGAFRRFMTKRLVRIYPLYFLSFIVMVVLARFSIGIPVAAADLLMLQSWIPDRSFYFSANSPAWFISDLMFCYLLFLPAMRLYVRRPGIFKAVAALIFILYFAVVLLTPEWLTTEVIYILPLMQFPVFLLGFVLCKFQLRRPRLYRNPGAVALASLATIIVLMAIYQYVPTRYSLSSLWWLPLAFLVTSLAECDRSRKSALRALEWPFAVAFGDASFSFYIIHLPWIRVWEIIMGKVCPGIGIYLSCILCLALLIPFSIAVRKYFEVPVTRFLDRRLHGRAR